ncbi:uncharacterized protein SOCE836_049740 [Sorangium cellulosum]|uniref:Uncharacterized protein n=1 Tax=Sorangium cellulosum TaxID=56 RepID=A0A4P2QRC2_SORCE|nr:uncharacterized protein SOCE836_049740 [Sorangium cellulosum]
MQGFAQGAGVAPWSMDLPDFDDDGEPFARRFAGRRARPSPRPRGRRSW